MISSISDLLNEFVQKEVQLLNKQSIKHPPTIGAMYEGLTKEIFSKALFKGIDLKVVTNSFIEGCNTEFDLLLVEGSGTQVPYTSSYTYNAENVIAVVQAKKNLYSKDLREGYENLYALAKYIDPKKAKPYVGRMFRDSFKSVCRKEITPEFKKNMALWEESIYDALLTDAFLPLRIVWGYNGFSSEYNFRLSFFNYLNQNRSTKDDTKEGFGVNSFPNLIICGKHSMIKGNGMPYIMQLSEKNYWSFYTTTSGNPTKSFLEVLWTRLSYMFDLPTDIFGEDLEIETVNRYLDGKYIEKDGTRGWDYSYFNMKEELLSIPHEVKEWQPAFIDQKQFVIIDELCRKGMIDILNDADLESFVIEKGDYKDLNDFLNKLVNTGLVYIESGKLKLLTEQCQCVFLPDGMVVAGENKSGRLTNWVNKEIKLWKEKKNKD